MLRLGWVRRQTTSRIICIFIRMGGVSWKPDAHGRVDTLPVVKRVFASGRVRVVGARTVGRYHSRAEQDVTMPKLAPKTIGLIAAAGFAAIVVAGLLSMITSTTLGFSGEAVREGALNVVSLVVAFLLVAGIGRQQKDKS
ncbi:hypothetical protein RPD_1392 [Rhodopseudomonas palustris BisB5]|uniref:Uncharacterized protein n=2 Tax=Rhodopseudomonas TaxID=1073 RepID=Q13BB0_RHOPS|nr:hypothetical protein RPD_1392 [Rhodopseudomonas palustris BisB5]